MATMVAKYERDKKLNVRKEPHMAAEVVRKLEKGDAEEVKRIANGWCELADGFAKAEFLVIELGDAAKMAKPKKAEPEPEAEEKAELATEPEPEAAPAYDEDEAAELRKMTNPQLYNLAEQSGIKVKKGANKEALIAAILADE